MSEEELEKSIEELLQNQQRAYEVEKEEMINEFFEIEFEASQGIASEKDTYRSIRSLRSKYLKKEQGKKCKHEWKYSHKVEAVGTRGRSSLLFRSCAVCGIYTLSGNYEEQRES